MKPPSQSSWMNSMASPPAARGLQPHRLLETVLVALGQSLAQHERDRADAVGFGDEIDSAVHLQRFPRLAQIDRQRVGGRVDQVERVRHGDDVALVVVERVKRQPDRVRVELLLVSEDEPFLAAVDVEVGARNPALMVHQEAEAAPASSVELSEEHSGILALAQGQEEAARDVRSCFLEDLILEGRRQAPEHRPAPPRPDLLLCRSGRPNRQ